MFSKPRLSIIRFTILSIGASVTISGAGNIDVSCINNVVSSLGYNILPTSSISTTINNLFTMRLSTESLDATGTCSLNIMSLTMIRIY